jgi:hypothetical protein
MRNEANRTRVSALLSLCITVAAAAAGVAGCSAMSSDDAVSGNGNWGGFGFDAAAFDGSTASDSAGTTDSGSGKLPTEIEKEVDFGAPEGSPNFVYVPMKGEDTVVKVSGSTLAVTLVEVGDRPTVVRAVPGKDAVVVISSGTDELAVVTSTEASDDVRLVPIVPHCNAVDVSPDGAWAIVWYDHDRAGKSDPVGSFQAVSLVPIDAAGGSSRTLSTGFRPREVQFTADGTRALVITDDGVSIVTLADAKNGDVVPPRAIDDNPLSKPAEREVRTTSDGVWAIVRQSGLLGIFAVHLPTGQLIKVDLGSAPTDLDLRPDGSAALAVLRDTAEVAIIDLPTEVTLTLKVQKVSVAPLVAGLARITDDSKTAILYTSVAGIESVARLDLTTRKVTPVLLRKTIDYVWLAKGSRTALLVHKPADGPLHNLDDTEAFVDDSYGYTLFDLDTGYTKLVLTSVAPAGIAASKAPNKAWVLLPGAGGGVDHKVQSAGLDTLLVQEFALASRPEYVRSLEAAGVMAVSQLHASGRMTFVDSKTGAAKTVTGYELNGLVK